MKEYFEKLLQVVCERLQITYPEGVVVTEPPEHVPADISVNIAMVLAKALGKNPREIAEQFKVELLKFEEVGTVEIAGPGFLNLQIANTSYLRAIKLDTTAIAPAGKPKKVLVEYVSANPTGPLHIGNARGGPVGETIARVLEAVGYTVGRDFYVNDVGGQANKFGESVLHYYLEYFGVPSTFPEKGYPAPYVKELALEIGEAEGRRIADLPESERVEAMRKVAIARMVDKIRATTDRMGIHFDTWFWQGSLLESGRSLEVLEELKKNDMTFEKDGALWLKSGILEDDRETVLRKNNNVTTYFLDDIAYHKDKLVVRGYDYTICLLGANHSGHIPRMEASMVALGFSKDKYRGVLYQYVQLKEGEETRRMAKREGTFVTADDVLNEVPLEVFNYFMLSKANETHLDFDLQLAKDTSEKNPVYYIQYAHARICSVLERARENGAISELPETYDFSTQERRLIRQLGQFSNLVNEVAESYRTHLLPQYLHELASRYHHFYAHQRIVSDNPSETAVRVRLSELTAATLRKGLNLLNIAAQEKM